MENVIITDEQLESLVISLFKNGVNDNLTSKGIGFRLNGDGFPVFELTIEAPHYDARFDIKFQPPISYYKELLKNILDTTAPSADLLSKWINGYGVNLANKAELINRILNEEKEILLHHAKDDIELLICAFETVFSQASMDVAVLWNELKKIDESQMLSKANAIFSKRKSRQSSSFSVKKAVSKSAKVYADYQRKVQKDTFQKAASSLSPDLPEKKVLFDIFYKQLLPQWKDAKRVYTKNKKHEKWRSFVSAAYNEFPPDLIERLSNSDKIEKMPSEIALIHSARICGLNEYIARSTLHLYLKESKQWIKQTSSEEVKELFEAYTLPDLPPFNVLDVEADVIM